MHDLSSGPVEHKERGVDLFHQRLQVRGALFCFVTQRPTLTAGLQPSPSTGIEKMCSPWCILRMDLFLRLVWIPLSRHGVPLMAASKRAHSWKRFGLSPPLFCAFVSHFSIRFHLLERTFIRDRSQARRRPMVLVRPNGQHLQLLSWKRRSPPHTGGNQTRLLTPSPRACAF
jgi:hypothetical protein